MRRNRTPAPACNDRLIGLKGGNPHSGCGCELPTDRLTDNAPLDGICKSPRDARPSTRAAFIHPSSSGRREPDARCHTGRHEHTIHVVADHADDDRADFSGTPAIHIASSTESIVTCDLSSSGSGNSTVPSSSHRYHSVSLPVSHHKALMRSCLRLTNGNNEPFVVI